MLHPSPLGVEVLTGAVVTGGAETVGRSKLQNDAIGIEHHQETPRRGIFFRNEKTPEYLRIYKGRGMFTRVGCKLLRIIGIFFTQRWLVGLVSLNHSIPPEGHSLQQPRSMNLK